MLPHKSLVSVMICIAISPVIALSQTRPTRVTTTTAPTVRGPQRWEKAIAEYEKQDKENPPPKGALLFTGASSIRMWKSLPQAFADQTVLNRGFGGSEIADATYFADRIIFPYEPKMILL